MRETKTVRLRFDLVVDIDIYGEVLKEYEANPTHFDYTDFLLFLEKRDLFMVTAKERLPVGCSDVSMEIEFDTKEVIE